MSICGPRKDVCTGNVVGKTGELAARTEGLEGASLGDDETVMVGIG